MHPSRIERNKKRAPTYGQRMPHRAAKHVLGSKPDDAPRKRTSARLKGLKSATNLSKDAANEDAEKKSTDVSAAVDSIAPTPKQPITASPSRISIRKLHKGSSRASTAKQPTTASPLRVSIRTLPKVSSRAITVKQPNVAGQLRKATRNLYNGSSRAGAKKQPITASLLRVSIRRLHNGSSIALRRKNGSSEAARVALVSANRAARHVASCKNITHAVHDDRTHAPPNVSTQPVRVCYIGEWISNADVDRNQVVGAFLDGRPEEALYFPMTWLPRECAYTRFTKDKFLANLGDLKWIHFQGDSVLRGVFCGIARLLAGGSEFAEPPLSPCGNKTEDPVSSQILRTDRIFNVTVAHKGRHLRLSYLYSYGLQTRASVTKRQLKSVLDARPKARSCVREISPLLPDAVIFSTGTWDYDKMSRSKLTWYDDRTNNMSSKPVCNAASYQVALARARAASWLSTFASSAPKTRFLLLNNHLNGRFDACCADEPLSRALVGSRWEVINVRALSAQLGLRATYDKLHYDRTQGAKRIKLSTRAPLAGLLEMQVAQTILNQLLVSPWPKRLLDSERGACAPELTFGNRTLISNSLENPRSVLQAV